MIISSYVVFYLHKTV